MRTRFLVDIISGTSAGGINNGVFLAKAIANGQEFDVATDLWVEGAQPRQRAAVTTSAAALSHSTAARWRRA